MSHATDILDAGLENAVASGIPSVIAITGRRDGVFNQGFEGFRRIGHPAPSTLKSALTLFSSTKAITTTAALQLWEVGDLDLDAPVRQYAPENGALQAYAGFGSNEEPRPRPPESEMTTRMLLNHTAGLSYDFLNADRASLWARPGAAAGRGREAELMAALVVRARRGAGT